MKIIKYIIIIILSIIGILLIMALFIPKNFHAEGRTTIKKPQSFIYNYVKQLKTQEHYSVWFTMDPNLSKQYTGNDGEMGAQLVWKSKEVGNGKQVITNLEPFQKVEIDLYLMKEDGEPNKYLYQLHAIDEQSTEVIISVDGHTPYPMNIMSIFFNMNEYFQQNADNLKIVLEK